VRASTCCNRFDVLGISWGGRLAQQLAFQNPHRCRRLVLVSTGTGMLMVPARSWVLSKMLTPRRYRDPAYPRWIAAELYGGRIREQPDHMTHRYTPK
jgi:pimeloyl-ACP methyl ester carboxylesterase